MRKGAITGGIEIMITFPLEFIKVCACMYTGSIITRIEQSYHTSAPSHRRAIVDLL